MFQGLRVYLSVWRLVETGVWVAPERKRGTFFSLCKSSGDTTFASVNPEEVLLCSEKSERSESG